LRRINLLSPEERRRRVAVPTTTKPGILGLLLILGALLVMLMIGLYLFYFIRLGNEEDRIAQLDQEITRQQAHIQELGPFRDLQARLNAKKPIADGIFRTRFPWDEFLRGLAFVIPDSTALERFEGRATPINVQVPTGGAQEVQNLEPPGFITFSGVALPGYQNVADFVVRMNYLRFLANAHLNRAELDRQTFARPAITFEVRAQLVTRVGESGDEVRIDDDESQDGADDEAAPQDERANRPEAVNY
jgi:type IV pilus assembly protein PilN